MKNKVSVLLILIIILCVISNGCSSGSNESTTSKSSENNDLSDEIAQIKQLNNELFQKMASLNATIDNLKQNLYEATEGSPLQSNYYIDTLLREFFMRNPDDISHTIDIFPGMLKDIKVETNDERILFVFSIDRMEMNPDWNGPGTDVFINKEVKYEEYKGGLDTVFEFEGYESYEAKQSDILQKYNDAGLHEFFLIDDEIVFVGPDPGP